MVTGSTHQGLLGVSKVTLLSQLQPDDIVRTPLGRRARVTAFFDDRVSCTYLDDGEEVVLLPRLLTFERRP